MKPKCIYRPQNFMKKPLSDKSDSSYGNNQKLSTNSPPIVANTDSSNGNLNLPTNSPILVKTESDFLGKQDSLTLNNLNNENGNGNEVYEDEGDGEYQVINTIQSMGDKERISIGGDKQSFPYEDYNNKKFNKISLIKDDKQKKVLFGDKKMEVQDEKKYYIQNNEDFNNFLKDTIDYFKKDSGLKTKNQEINQIYTILKEEQEKTEIITNNYNKLEEKYKHMKQKYNDLKEESKNLTKQSTRNEFESNSEFMQSFIYLKEKNQLLEDENKYFKRENFQFRREIKKLKR